MTRTTQDVMDPIGNLRRAIRTGDRDRAISLFVPAYEEAESAQRDDHWSTMRLGAKLVMFYDSRDKTSARAHQPKDLERSVLMACLNTAIMVPDPQPYTTGYWCMDCGATLEEGDFIDGKHCRSVVRYTPKPQPMSGHGIVIYTRALSALWPLDMGYRLSKCLGSSLGGASAVKIHRVGWGFRFTVDGVTIHSGASKGRMARFLPRAESLDAVNVPLKLVETKQSLDS